MTFDDLVSALRQVEGLRDKGKVHPNFHFKSRPFLHFHSDELGTHADVRFGPDFEAVPASTPEEREHLLSLVRDFVGEAHNRP